MAQTDNQRIAPVVYVNETGVNLQRISIGFPFPVYVNETSTTTATPAKTPTQTMMGVG